MSPSRLPYGEPSAPITVGRVGSHEVAFLPRHGLSHEFSPHRSLPRQYGPPGTRGATVFGPCAVGSLTAELGWARSWCPTNSSIAPAPERTPISTPEESTWISPIRTAPRYVPWSPNKREWSTAAPWWWCRARGSPPGPRASGSPARASPLVNMTGYPEAVLARELEMCYAAIALVTDIDAGVDVGSGVRAADVFAEFQRNIGPFKDLVHRAIDRVATERVCTHCLAHAGVELPFDLP